MIWTVHPVLIGMFGTKYLLVLHYVSFVCGESVLGLKIQQHLGWSSLYHLQCWSGADELEELLLNQAVQGLTEHTASQHYSFTNSVNYKTSIAWGLLGDLLHSFGTSP